MSGPLRVADVDEMTGDDLLYWLSNPFMAPEMLAEKVCWWVQRSLAAQSAREVDDGQSVEEFLRSLADSPDMPMHHAADIEQWLDREAHL